MSKRPAILILKFLFAAALLVWLVRSDQLDLSVLKDDLTNPLHGLGLLLILSTLLPQSLRWQWLMKSQGIAQPLSRIVKWNWIGEFFALTLPGGAGTELSRGFYVYKNSPDSRAAALSTVVMDRLFGLFSLLFVGAFSALIIVSTRPISNNPMTWLAVILILSFVAGLVCWGMIYLGAVRSFIVKVIPLKYSDHLETILEAYIKNSRPILYAFVLSVVNQLLILGLFFVSALMLDIHLPWEVVFFVVPYVLVSNVIPLTPSGIGVGEVAAAYLFLQFDIPEGAAIMLIVRLWLIAFQLSGGLVFLFYQDKRPSPLAS